MKECDYCQHVEMCRWRKDVEEQGCEFFDDGNKWIPVSERLPDIHYYESYLVTLKNGGIRVALFTECNGKHWWTYDDVIAWMPLPKPYKAESEG